MSDQDIAQAIAAGINKTTDIYASWEETRRERINRVGKAREATMTEDEITQELFNAFRTMDDNNHTRR